MISPARTAIVIGGTGAIGSVLALALATEGYRVHVVSRGSNAHDEELDRRCEIHRVDVADESRFVDFLRERCGTADVLIYAAGRIPDPEIALAAYSCSDWKQNLDVYLTGFFLSLREALRSFKEGGHVIAISSAVTRFSGDKLPPLNLGHYSATKAALDELCKWGRRDAHQRGLLLSRVAPSAVECAYHATAPAYRLPPRTVPMKTIRDTIMAAIERPEEIDVSIVA